MRLENMDIVNKQKVSIRRGVFETNSSSVHTISISKNHDNLDIPKEIIFKLDDYGWEVDTLSDIQSRASYFWTALHQLKNDANLESYIRKISIHFYKTFGITCIFDKEDSSYGHFIDHGDELIDFVNAVCEDMGLLELYLLGRESHVCTGNDGVIMTLTDISDGDEYIKFIKYN